MVAAQQGQELVAHAVAQRLQQDVGGVQAGREALLLAITLALATAHHQQRPHQSQPDMPGGGPGGTGLHAGDAGETAAADDVHEHRFDLIAAGVAGGHAACVHAFSLAGQEGVAQDAGRLLQR